MPSVLRAKVAVVGLFAVLMIPIYTSTLRGLTHVLTCEKTTDADFTVFVDGLGRPTLSSSVAIEPDTNRELCGGLVADFAVGSRRPGHAQITITITNNTDYDWQGSIELHFADTQFPISIGKIESGTTQSETVNARIRKGHDYQIDGALLIGP